jgi:sec-independent protein translocase protein TatB
MFFDIGAGEILGLAILGVILVGPERLPHVAAEAAKLVKKLRALSQTATAELRENLGPGFENLQPADLNPKTFIKKQLADALDEGEKPATKKINAKIDPDLL